MTNDPQTPSASNPNTHPNTGGDRQLAIATRWEKPVVGADGGEATLLVRIVAPAQDDTGAQRAAPLDIAFVLDRSGSMHGGKLELAKEGVDVALSRLRDVDRAALVVYDDAVDTVQPLASTTPRMKASLRLALHGIDPGGSTFLSGGWVAGCHELAEATPVSGEHLTAARIRRVVLLTDGLANVRILDPGELARHAGELRRRGIATTTVGVGQDFDEGLLSAMAEAGGGNFQISSTSPARRGYARSSPTSSRSCSASRRPHSPSRSPRRRVSMPTLSPRSRARCTRAASRWPSAICPLGTRSTWFSPSAPRRAPWAICSPWW